LKFVYTPSELEGECRCVMLHAFTVWENSVLQSGSRGRQQHKDMKNKRKKGNAD
jgi:hypothetical protein